MHDIENSSTEGKRNKWPGWAIADIHDKIILADIQSFEI